jgi:hypothetical protein
MDSDHQITPAPTGDVDDGKMNFFAKLAALVLDPRRTFKAEAVRPLPVPPIILLVCAALVFVIATKPFLMEEMVTADQVERLAEIRNISPKEAQTALEKQQEIMSIGVYVLAPLAEVFSCLIFAAILLFVGNVVLGGTAGFLAILSAYAWAKVITIIGTIVKIPMVLSTGSSKVTLSPAILLPESASDSLLFSVLSVFDVFHIWEAVLVCYAIAVVYKIGMQRAVGFVGTLYVVLAAIGIILGQLF